MSISQHIGQVIYAERMRAKLSQRQLAALMGVPRTYISKVENDAAVPVLQSLEKFAESLKLKVSDIVILAEAAKDKPVSKRERPRVSKGGRQKGKKMAYPRRAMVLHPTAVEHRREIGRALGTLPKETR